MHWCYWLVAKQAQQRKEQEQEQEQQAQAPAAKSGLVSSNYHRLLSAP